MCHIVHDNTDFLLKINEFYELSFLTIETASMYNIFRGGFGVLIHNFVFWSRQTATIIISIKFNFITIFCVFGIILLHRINIIITVIVINLYM